MITWILALIALLVGAAVVVARILGRRDDPEFEGMRAFLRGPWLVVVGVVVALGAGLALFDQMFFYAEPGYVYHVRTITGEEKVVKDVGYNAHMFGRYNAWKRAMTVQAAEDTRDTQLDAENESTRVGASASLPPLNIMFLDQVDANIQATARFAIPTDHETFLVMAHQFRSPTNLLRTALIPAFKETLQATGSLMSAEEYYSGGRSEFNSEFERQMHDGIYIVHRLEVLAESSRPTSGSANAALGTNQAEYGDESKMIFVVEKEMDSTGQVVRERQNFTDYGISIVEARVTDLRPNQRFVERMQLKQKASADRAIAREQRIQEEEQRLLAIAKGEREVAERQASAKVVQIERTTEAQTEKQLAITKAEKFRAEAAIAKETAAIELEKAKLEAKTQRTLAEAEAYQKKVILGADNALAQKLDAEIKIHELWAGAYAQRAVPANVFGASADSGIAVGSDGEARHFMQLLTLDAAKRLSYDREVGGEHRVARK